MPREDHPDGPDTGSPDPWSREGPDEPEPDWAEQIRQGRKARGERLKDLFATFDQPGRVDEVVPDDPEEGEGR
jgi:hypothetical protein